MGYKHPFHEQDQVSLHGPAAPHHLIQEPATTMIVTLATQKLESTRARFHKSRKRSYLLCCFWCGKFHMPKAPKHPIFSCGETDINNFTSILKEIFTAHKVQLDEILLKRNTSLKSFCTYTSARSTLNDRFPTNKVLEVVASGVAGVLGCTNITTN